MNPVLLAAFGWLVPGGAYLLTRRYLQAALFACVVTAAFVAGVILQGGAAWPSPAELDGVDSFTALIFKAGALGRFLAGGPYLMNALFGGSGSFLNSRLHEYGSTLLVMAGAFNVLAISSALDSRKEVSAA